MTQQSIEERLDSLETSNKKLASENKELRKKLEHLQAIYEVDNLMNKYEIKLQAGLYEEVEDMFALNTPGVRAEMAWGVYEGVAGIRKLFSGGWHRKMMGDTGALKPGFMFVLPNSNPVIEVAEDGKTAKAIWICIGHETVPGDAKMQALWCYARRAADFIKENGAWKIWHYHVYGGFMSPFEKSWAEGFDHRPVMIPEGCEPDKPPTTTWMYKPDLPFRYEPVSPDPYEIFDEENAY